jgi:hypothetical protein
MKLTPTRSGSALMTPQTLELRNFDTTHNHSHNGISKNTVKSTNTNVKSHQASYVKHNCHKTKDSIPLEVNTS